ncbi:hypothetical protein [Nocardia wallacei]|uniref:Uncharacterized protein n=2 Tax=Nocardia wallacei TaxID=480035 RepID=A0A7G1KHS2_9NOCA|nr:hypothetical protein [Nocardia wallacei]BCK54705.1 hypothetical protein NWFMUON74_24770 [Nocardia wallacei]
MLHWPLSVIAVAGTLLAAFVAINLAALRADGRRRKLPGAPARNTTAARRKIPSEDTWLPSSMHRPPGHPLTVDEAHRVMQRHLNCGTDNCISKAIAFSVLVQHGRIKPDSSRSAR